MVIKFVVKGNFRDKLGNPSSFNRLPFAKSQYAIGNWEYQEFKRYIREAFMEALKGREAELAGIQGQIKSSFDNTMEPIRIREQTCKVSMIFYWTTHKAVDALALYAAVCDAIFADIYCISKGDFNSFMAGEGGAGKISVLITINEQKNDKAMVAEETNQQVAEEGQGTTDTKTGDGSEIL